MSCLFHDVILDYHVPIISQQGEVAGRLQVRIERVSGSFPDSNCPNVNLNGQNAYSNSLNNNSESNAEDCGFVEDSNNNMVIKVHQHMR